MQPDESLGARSGAAIPLGPFVLQRPIGAGGMGEVWQGVHVEEHVPVAIKVIADRWARHDGHRRAFQREVRAVAGLSHPGIVAVFDDGIVDAEAAARSEGRLAAGSPFLVMEYLPRGSLEWLLPALDWPLVQLVARGTLAALAHAHARGVVHCDLKPGNILLAGFTEVAVKLTDFGVAHAFGGDEGDAGEGEASSAGTPAYMAPEQLLGQVRDYGPWTDLYALGCTLWELCCGEPPFLAPDLPRLAAMHLYEEPGDFRPLFAAPRGTEAWLRRLLAKRPAHRYQRAADALRQLRALAGSADEAAVAWSTVAARRETRAEQSPTRPGRGTAPEPSRRFVSLSLSLTTGSAPDPRAMTDLWRTPEPGERDMAEWPFLMKGHVDSDMVESSGDAALARGPAGPQGASQGAAFERTLLARPPVAPGAARQDDGAAERAVAEASDGSALGIAEAGGDGGERAVVGSRDGAAERAVGEASRRGGASLIPPSWRLPHDAAGFRPLLGAGLGLVRVRELPLVGREAERDRLWAALGRVHAEGRPRLVLVRGPSGVGKSRLVEWTAARAHELGAAEVLRAVHGPFGGPAEGLSRMLAAHLRCVGLGGDEVFARCLAAIDPTEAGGGQARLEAAALTDLLCPGDVGAGRPRVRLQDARERHHVLSAQLTRIAAACPLVVWIDDAQWGGPALEFARYCLHANRGPRALFVATIRDDLLAERPVEAALVAALAELPVSETLSVEPLPEDQHRALIEELLGIERGLVDAIVARTAGNPLFSVQLVGDWIARGLLRPGRGGFTLREGAAVELPDDLHALWRRRIEGLIERRFAGPAGAAARAALELAAAIGQEIDAAAWARACALAGIEAPAELGLVLVRERLAVATPTGFAFAHGMLRESLERMAAEAGRAAGHHRVCAALLRELGAGRASPWEIARHLIAAGELAEALDPLLQASYQLQLAGEYRAAEGALDQHQAVADRLGLPPHDRERLRGRMQRAWLAWMRGGAESGAGRGSAPNAGDRGAAEVEAITALARNHGHDDVLGEALRWRGLVARFERRFAASLAALAEAAACFERAGDGEGQARTALAQAVTLRALGRTDEAEARLGTAEALARARGLAVLLPRVLGNLAEIALQRRDWPEAHVRFARALEAAEQIGDRKALALTAGGAGDLAFVRDAFAAAEAHYRRAEALLAALGSRYLGGIRLHLAALDALRGRADALPALRAATSGDDPLLAALGHLALAATSDEHAALAEHLRGAAEQLACAGEVRPVLARLAERAGENARRRGYDELAREAEALARELATRLAQGEAS